MTQLAWKRSLAGAVLFAALAPVADAPRAQGPPPGAPGGAAGEGRGERQNAIEDARRRIDQANGKLNVLRLQLEEVQKVAAVNVDAEAQVRKLREQVAKLKEEKAKVEAELKELQERRIRVFRLKHARPEEVRLVLENLLAGPAAGGMGAMMTGGPPGMMMPRMPGMGAGSMRPPGMKMGGMPGGPGGAGAGEDPGWRITVDERTRSLIVRGSRHDLEVAADLVAVLDQAEGKAAPKVRNLHAFKLKYAQAPALAQILDELGVKARVFPIQKNVLIVTGPPEALKEISDLVKELDVEGREGD